MTYFLSQILILAISRYREFAADRGSALITGAPENLMSALQKIASGITQIPQQDLRQVEGMNAFFIIPTNWRKRGGELFMTHPPLESGWPRSPRSRARWAGRSRNPWACATSSSGASSSRTRRASGSSRSRLRASRSRPSST